MKLPGEWCHTLALVSIFGAPLLWSGGVFGQVGPEAFGNATSGRAQCTRLLEVIVLGILDTSPTVANMSAPPSFSLITRRSTRRESLRVMSDGRVISNSFDPKKDTKFIIHGFLGGGTNEWILDLTKALLQWGDVNVIVVDWSRAAMSAYPQAAENTAVIGRAIARLINALHESFGADLETFHLIGHSLGSHVSGYAGAALQGQIKRITGMDPAGPLFTNADKSRRLDASDAKFVDVIHTDKECLGSRIPMGHVDFYPNGGSSQPGCGSNMGSYRSENNIGGTFAALDSSFCSHFRAVRFFIDSILASPPHGQQQGGETSHVPQCSFIGVLCASQADFERGTCDTSVPEDSRTAIMGIDADTFPWQNSKDPPPMTYYLKTNHVKPYCIS